jgi:endonuclease/exonuclease/phosphatase family metal-dependent hydrolase
MMRWLIAATALAAGFGCTRGGDSPERDAGGSDGGLLADGAVYPPPRTDLVPAVGGPATLDLATWNIENFPADGTTPRVVADLVASMDLDIVAIQEIADVAAWNELVARLPEHGGLLSEHTYSNGTFQKVGFLYREGLVELSAGILLFAQTGFEFPRPPLQAIASVDDGVNPPLDFVIITLHLKAGQGDLDRQRREEALVLLEDHISQSVVGGGLDSEVVILGDFNETVTDFEGEAVFDPFRLEPASYTLRSEPLADDFGVSFLPGGVMLDHVITTTALDQAAGGADELIPPLHLQLSGYEGIVSDHLPVVLRLPIF